eukprot:10050594-Alexandrium_andersonii.AAC.1
MAGMWNSLMHMVVGNISSDQASHTIHYNPGNGSSGGMQHHTPELQAQAGRGSEGSNQAAS